MSIYAKVVKTCSYFYTFEEITNNLNMLKYLLSFLIILLNLSGCSVRSDKNSSGLTEGQGIVSPNGMVVSDHPLASRTGVEILKKGGNAIDAAIATELALAVCYPEAGNIGGGGFMVIRTKDGKADAIDFREKAPAGMLPGICTSINTEL